MFLKSKYIAGLLTTVTVASGFSYLPNSESGMDTSKQNLNYELNVFHLDALSGFDQKLESLKADKEEVDQQETGILSLSRIQQTIVESKSKKKEVKETAKEETNELSFIEKAKLRTYFKDHTMVDEEKVEGYLNIRAEAAADETVEVLGKLYPGAVAEILEEQEEWSRIQSGDVTGWVKNEYLLFGEDAMKAVGDKITYEAEVLADTLNVRAGAGTEYEVLEILTKGDCPEVVEETDGWVEIKLTEEATGFVSEDFVEVDYAFPEAVSLQQELANDTETENVAATVEEETMANGQSLAIAEEETAQTEAAAQAAAQEAAEAAAQAAAQEAARQQAAAEEAARQQAAQEAAAQAAAQEAARQQAAAEAEAKKKYLGTFRITYYCPCTQCCGIWGTDAPGATVVGSSGQQLIAGYSVAVNPAQIPYGTKLIINGKTYIAADSGVGSNCIDIFSSSHSEALQGGMYYADVYLA